MVCILLIQYAVKRVYFTTNVHALVIDRKLKTNCHQWSKVVINFTKLIWFEFFIMYILCRCKPIFKWHRGNGRLSTRYFLENMLGGHMSCLLGGKHNRNTIIYKNIMTIDLNFNKYYQAASKTYILGLDSIYFQNIVLCLDQDISAKKLSNPLIFGIWLKHSSI